MCPVAEEAFIVSVVVRAGLYMNVGGRPSVIYTILCLTKASKSRENRHIWVFGAAVSFIVAILEA